MAAGTHLEVQEERDPLVVFVVPDFVLVVGAMPGRSGHARVRNLLAHLGPGQGRDGEGRVDPAVRIHDAAVDSFHYTVDGVAEVLLLRDQQTERHQYEHSPLVV